jgi:hypothetical protein
MEVESPGLSDPAVAKGDNVWTVHSIQSVHKMKSGPCQIGLQGSNPAGTHF